MLCFAKRELPSTTWAFHRIGERYWGVPLIVAVVALPPSSFGLNKSFDSPKSMTFICPLFKRNKFAGFKSRWQRPWLYMWDRVLINDIIIFSISACFQNRFIYFRFRNEKESILEFFVCLIIHIKSGNPVFSKNNIHFQHVNNVSKRLDTSYVL